MVKKIEKNNETFFVSNDDSRFSTIDTESLLNSSERRISNKSKDSSPSASSSKTSLSFHLCAASKSIETIGVLNNIRFSKVMKINIMLLTETCFDILDAMKNEEISLLSMTIKNNVQKTYNFIDSVYVLHSINMKQFLKEIVETELIFIKKT